MIKYIIFDLDGVLFDGCELHARLFINAVLKITPDTKLTKEYHDTVLNGLSTRKKLEYLNIVGEEAKQIFTLKQSMTKEYISNNIHSNPKNKEICESLMRSGYKLYCVTNSIRSTVENVLKGMSIIDMFSGIISNEDIFEPKPSPEPYLTLYENYNLDAKECMIIEDSDHGIESAIRSGGRVFCVRDCEDVQLTNIMEAIAKLNSGNNYIC
jgi:HAD superfamily hydrolase (TIGR01509 family)